MKKLISLLLVVMMLCSISTVAFAADTNIGVGQKSNTAAGDGNGSAKTELWLQVKAEGQIDVTVPLVVVFQTNIDGGNAIAAENYNLINNGYAPLAVTGVKIETNDNQTTLDTYANATTDKVDTYGVQLSAAKSATDTTLVTLDAKTINAMTNNEHKIDAVAGGHFQLPGKAKDASAGQPTNVDVAMKTGKFSFVTEHVSDGVLDAAKGVKLLTVTYTVALDAKQIANNNAAINDSVASDKWESGNDNVTSYTTGN